MGKENILGRIRRSFDERRERLSKGEGDACLSCGATLELKKIKEEDLGIYEIYGGGYAGASNFKSGEPDEHRYKITMQVNCPKCDWRGRAFTQEISIPIEENEPSV